MFFQEVYYMDDKIVKEILQIVMENDDREMETYIHDNYEHQLALLACIQNHYIAGITGSKNAAGGAIFEKTEKVISLTEKGVSLLNA